MVVLINNEYIALLTVLTKQLLQKVLQRLQLHLEALDCKTHEKVQQISKAVYRGTHQHKNLTIPLPN